LIHDLKLTQEQVYSSIRGSKWTAEMIFLVLLNTADQNIVYQPTVGYPAMWWFDSNACCIIAFSDAISLIVGWI
jgi:hypothetical protein